MSAKRFSLWDHFDGIFLKRMTNQKTPDFCRFSRNSQNRFSLGGLRPED